MVFPLSLDTWTHNIAHSAHSRLVHRMPKQNTTITLFLGSYESKLSRVGQFTAKSLGDLEKDSSGMPPVALLNHAPAAATLRVVGGPHRARR